MEHSNYIPNKRRTKPRPGVYLPYNDEVLAFTVNKELIEQAADGLTYGGVFLILTNIDIGGVNLNASFPQAINAEVVDSFTNPGGYKVAEFLMGSSELQALSLTRQYGQSIQMTLNQRIPQEYAIRKALEHPVYIQVERSPRQSNLRAVIECRVRIYANHGWSFVRSEIQKLSNDRVIDNRTPTHGSF